MNKRIRAFYCLMINIDSVPAPKSVALGNVCLHHISQFGNKYLGGGILAGRALLVLGPYSKRLVVCVCLVAGSIVVVDGDVMG